MIVRVEHHDGRRAANTRSHGLVLVASHVKFRNSRRRHQALCLGQNGSSGHTRLTEGRGEKEQVHAGCNHARSRGIPLLAVPLVDILKLLAVGLVPAVGDLDLLPHLVSDRERVDELRLLAVDGSNHGDLVIPRTVGADAGVGLTVVRAALVEHDVLVTTGDFRISRHVTVLSEFAGCAQRYTTEELLVDSVCQAGRVDGVWPHQHRHWCRGPQLASICRPR